MQYLKSTHCIIIQNILFGFYEGNDHNNLNKEKIKLYQKYLNATNKI